MDIPRDYNAAEDLIGRNLEAGRGGKTAFVDDAGSYTYAQLAERVDRAANAIRALGIEREKRIAIAMLDGCDWPAVFLGAIKAGIVPVAMNTLLTPSDYQYQLRDSRARALFVSEPLLKSFEPIRNKCPDLKHVVVAGKQLSDMLAAAPAKAAAAQTTSDDVCFWLYSSGSTGAPKGTVHLHSHLILTADTYAKQVLGIRESDVVFSAAKLFFAYGLGNALTFPKSVGGYQLRLVDDQGNVVTKPGELGELQIGGPTAAIMYWNQREKTKNTFQGPWTRSGDKYSVDEEGYYVYGGRADDMLKVSGIWVSPV